MATVYCENTHTTLHNYEATRSTTAYDKQEIICSDLIKSNYHNDIKPEKYFHLISQNNSSYNELDEISFNLNEWMINDTKSGKFRVPRQIEFLLLLLEKQHYSSYISWLNKDKGLCQIHRPQQVANLWTKVKRRHTMGIMDYDTFARAIRLYYKSGLMIKTHKKYVLRFRLPFDIVSH